MTKIKTAKAWGYIKNDELLAEAGAYGNNSVVIIYGLTEAEIHEAAALLEKNREVCEWPKAYHQTKDGLLRIKTGCGLTLRIEADKTRPCWCGRKVVVK